MDSDYVEYSPEEIDLIKFNDANLYVSMDTEIDGQKKRYFVEQLIDGIVDVFYYPVKNGAFFLIRDEEGEIYELKNTRAEIQIGNSQYTKYKKEYAAVLKGLFKDSPGVLGKIDQLEYNPDSMVEIAEDYHNDVCSEYA